MGKTYPKLAIQSPNEGLRRRWLDEEKRKKRKEREKRRGKRKER